MCYPVCGMLHIKEPMLLIRKSSLCGSSGFPLSLSEWSFTICPTPYNRNYFSCPIILSSFFNIVLSSVIKYPSFFYLCFE